jgi:hypothetical protein
MSTAWKRSFAPFGRFISFGHENPWVEPASDVTRLALGGPVTRPPVAPPEDAALPLDLALEAALIALEVELDPALAKRTASTSARPGEAA